MSWHPRASTVVGVFAFLGVALLYEVGLPRGGGALAAGAGPPGRRSSEAGAREMDRLVPRSSAVESLAGTLALRLCEDTTWQQVDLADCRTVDQYGPLFERWLDEVLDEHPGRDEALLDWLDRVRSVRTRQLLLLVMGGVGRPDDIPRLASQLADPAMTACAAHAIGRIGGAAAFTTLLGAMEGVRPSAREALYFGLAQLGSAALPCLLEAAEKRLERGRVPDPGVLLGALRSAECRDALARIAAGHPQPAVRAMAVRGCARACRADGGDSDAQAIATLATLAGSADLDLGVRTEAVLGLAVLDTGAGQRVTRSILLQDDPSPELLLVALDGVAACGVAPDCLERVEALARDPDSFAVQHAALEALAAAATPETDRRVARLLGELSADGRREVFLALLTRTSLYRPLDAAPSAGLAAELLDAVQAALRASEHDTPERLLALRVLATQGDRQQELEDFLWSDYAEAIAAGHEAHRELAQRVPLLEERANEELERLFAASDQFVARIELGAALASIPGNLARARVRSFLSEVFLPYLRGALARNTGAYLAFVGPGRPGTNPYAQALACVFGLFGERGDLELLEGLAERFQDRQGNWPEPLREVIGVSLDEAAARASDLISMRSSR